MFESADEALAHWKAHTPAIASQTDRKDGLWHDQNVFRPDETDDGIHEETTQLVNVNERTNVALETAGLPSLLGLGHKSEYNALKLFFSGKSLQEACQLSKADQERVEALIRSAGADLESALSRALSEGVTV